jgi:DUF4097 and DUF4098 domain-containing protein YvlB
LKIDNRNGSVSVVGITGDQAITNAFADTVVKDLVGNIGVQNRNGRVEILNVKGNVKVTNSFANVTVHGVSEVLTLQNRNGSIDVADIGGSAKISNAFGSTVAKDIGGGLEIDTRNGSVEVEHVSGDVNVGSSYNQVRIRDPRGAVMINNRNGDVTVTFMQPPSKDVSISTEYSRVVLQVPSSSSFTVAARTRYGTIHSHFDELNPTANGNRNEQTLNGRVGQGGPTISLETRNGDIDLDKSVEIRK